jgi:hypothetical protein
MKRDMDLVRSLMIRLEELPIDPGSVVHLEPNEPELAFEGYSTAQVDYHLSLLREVGLIECPGSQPMIGVTFSRLTWIGHDFVDATRDPEIWRKTMKAADAAGSFTVEILVELAKAYIKAKIREHTGFNL